jgi:hypothetical protein
MVETDPHGTPEQNFSPLASLLDYELYCDEVFRTLETEQDPEIINIKAQDLLALALRHPELNPNSRLHELAFVSDLTMERLRRFTQRLNAPPDVVKQAEMLHTIYVQVYAQSMIELAKLTSPGFQAEGT